MEETGEVKPRNPPGAQMIYPVIPKDPVHHRELEEDLSEIGCLGFIDHPWTIKSDEMVNELIEGPPNQFQLTARGRPGSWSDDMWAEVYNCKKFGSGFATRGEKYLKGKFRNPAHSKEGYAISDCINERHARLLEFLIPILYPEEPTRVTAQVANTIFGAFKDRPVHWGKCLTHLIGKMVEHVAPGKPSPISAYLFHLYSVNDVMTKEEVVSYDVGYNILKYNFTDEVGKEKDSEPDPEGGEENVADAPQDPEDRQTIADPEVRGNQPLVTEAPPPGSIGSAVDFYEEGAQWVQRAKRHHENLVNYVNNIARELRVPAIRIPDAIRKMVGPEALATKDAAIRELEKTCNGLQARTD